MQATEILKRELARGSTASGSTDATESNPSAIESTAPTAKSTPSETEDDDDLVWVGRVKPSQAYKSKVTRKKRGKKTTSWAVE